MQSLRCAVLTYSYLIPRNFRLKSLFLFSPMKEVVFMWAVCSVLQSVVKNWFPFHVGCLFSSTKRCQKLVSLSCFSVQRDPLEATQLLITALKYKISYILYYFRIMKNIWQGGKQIKKVLMEQSANLFVSNLKSCSACVPVCKIL